MKKIFTFLIVYAAIMHQFSFGQWRSTLYPVNWSPQGNFYTDKIIQDFSYAGYHRGEQAIPSVTTNIKDVTAAPYYADKTGKYDVTSKIQQAINDVSAMGGGVVYLPAGTYKVSPGTNNHCLIISKSNVVLRGAGTANTFILNSTYQMRNKTIIKVQGTSGWYGTEYNKTLIKKDLTGPVKDIPVASASAYKAGDLVVLRNYINDSWINEHKITQWLGYGSSLRGLAFCREVVKVDYTNNIITVDYPIRYSLLTRDNSAVYKVAGMISETGIESLSIGNMQHPGTGGYAENDFNVAGTVAYDVHASYAISFSGVVNGWLNNVNTYKYTGNTSTAHLLSNGVVLIQTKNVTIQNCHFQRPQYGGGGGNGYMYRVEGSDNLITSCISEFTRHGFVFSNMCSSGNVIHKCTDMKTGSATGATGYYKTSGNGSDHHMHFSTSNLIDQCTSIDSYFAAGFRNYGGNPIHGITAAHSVFWNTNGSGTAFNKVVHTQQGRYGYAIGTSGSVSTVVTSEFSLPGSSSMTSPLDHVEGQGTGATLQPQSLYLDQLNKRLNVTDPCANNKAPVASLTSSASSLAAPASFTLTASATDADGTISKVEFYEGSTLLGSNTKAPYTLPLTGVTAGTHYYTAKATDNCSASVKSAVVTVTVTRTSNQPPVVTLTSPSSSLSLTAPASISLAATASDVDGTISKVEFYNGNTLIIADGVAPYSYTWSGLPTGTYSISAKAYDNMGAVTTSKSVSITVTAATSTVGISGPDCVVAGTTYTYSITTGSNATSASWWSNSDVTVTTDPANYKNATVKVNSATGSFILTCGVNYSGSPYYKAYTKTITIGGCTAKLAMNASVLYSENDNDRVMLDGKSIDQVRVLNTNGQMIRIIDNYSKDEYVTIPSDLPSNIYILQIISGDEVVNHKYVKN